MYLSQIMVALLVMRLEAVTPLAGGARYGENLSRLGNPK